MNVRNWLDRRRRGSILSMEEIAFGDSTEWRNDKGILRHTSGGFFSLEGLVADTGQQPANQPIVNQPEVGILGFLVTRKDDGYDWLLQAKCEPGNVHAVQIGPTVQATYSNYMQKHGGAPTYYLSFFKNTEDGSVKGTLQSEQGTRFLRKFNRNAVTVSDDRVEPATENYQWFPSSDLSEALLLDYGINTDARSVIVSSPWSYLKGDGPMFTSSRAAGWSGDDLERSYGYAEDEALVGRVTSWLDRLRREANHQTTSCALTELADWTFDKRLIRHRHGNGPLEVRHYRIDALDREKPHWDQPLVLSTGIDEVYLFCMVIDGVLKFLLRPSREIGLSGGIEIGPSYKHEVSDSYPAWVREIVQQKQYRTLAAAEQSDEGGRFMLSRCRYAIVEIDAPANVPGLEGDNLWVSLSGLETLCREPGLLTNEVRSVISLLLGYV